MGALPSYFRDYLYLILKQSIVGWIQLKQPVQVVTITTVVSKTFGYPQFEGPTLRGNVASYLLRRGVVGTLKFERPTFEWELAFIIWRLIK